MLWGAVGGAAFYAGEQAVAGAWKARSVFKKHGFKAGMRATWQNTKKSWSWKAFGGSVAIGAATGGLGMAASSAKGAALAAKAATGARAGRCRVITSGAKAANRVSRHRVPAKTFCFVAGTLVLTAQGPAPIEAVGVGEMVLSRDAATGEQALRPVTELYRNQTSELVHVDLGDETITATPGHPFWVEGTGWVDAGKLSAGDEVSLAEGSPATIVSVVREHLQSPVDVYNFQVAGFHTYFVASAGVWVHNACAAKWSVGNDITKATAKGKPPAWSTVRQRYWKNEAAKGGKWTTEQLGRMRQGKAPIGRDGRSMELHHIVRRTEPGSTNAAHNLRAVTRSVHTRYHKVFGYRTRY